MDYKIEFERLLAYAKQALFTVNIEEREVVGYAGLLALSQVIEDYETRIIQGARPCSQSPDGKHQYLLGVCMYCGSKIVIPGVVG